MNRSDWYQIAHSRLSKALTLSPVIAFNSHSRLAFMSDCHRGDGGRADLFRHNKSLFLGALSFYYDHDFTYIEVGDGDELWHNEWGAIRRANGRIVDLLQRFQDRERLHLIIGNHETKKGFFDPVRKEGICLQQGLLLEHEESGRRLFAVHGHQASQGDDRFWWFDRLISRYIWRVLLPAGFASWYHVSPPGPHLEPYHLIHLPQWLSQWILNKPRRLEHCIKAWSKVEQMPVICGHTHLAAFAANGGAPYYNTGNCISPNYMTSLEIQEGKISLIKWTAVAGRQVRSILRQADLTDIWNES